MPDSGLSFEEFIVETYNLTAFQIKNAYSALSQDSWKTCIFLILHEYPCEHFLILDLIKCKAEELDCVI